MPRTNLSCAAARLAALALTALGAAGPLSGPLLGAPAQEPDTTSITADGAELVARDARIGFDRRSAAFARVDLDELEPGDHGRTAALMALGAAGSVEARGRLVQETGPGRLTKERGAAAYALGELRGRIGDGLEVLIQLTADDEPTVARAALVALVRSGEAEGRSRVAKIAGGEDSLADEARRILAHRADPTHADPPASFRILYAYRWDAARNYGVVDGKVWGAALMEELADNEVFLEALVLQLVRDIELDDANDHLLEILFEGERAQRIITATEMMPFEVEALVDAGVWRPADWKEWKWLVLTVLHEELQSIFPRTLNLSIDEPVTRPIAAGLLQSTSDRYEELLLKAFEDDDPRNRAYAAYAVGASESTDFIPRLKELCTDPVAWTRANAIVALIRMKSQTGVERALDILAVPFDQREPLISSYLFEALSRAAPDPEVLLFLQEIVSDLSGPDLAAADSILLLHRVPRDTAVLRRELPLMNPTTPEAVRGIRALGQQPSSRDRRLLVRLFPRESAINANLELASALARAGHRSVEQLLQAAIWKLDWNLSILAAGVVVQTYGMPTLVAWAVTPPADVTDEDVRRVGYAVGEWGGMPSLEELRRALGTTGGAELPALQGAVLGALAARTR
ncbi:MAG: HEAT repeat domain-containing protein [Planctomycetota bacterium]